MSERELIIGVHSIAEAMKNSERTIYELVATDKGLEELKEKERIGRDFLAKIKVTNVGSHELQEMGKKWCYDLGFEYLRIPSQLFLLTSPTPIFDPSYIYEEIQKGKKLRIICLDQVTDVHNAAAILRTAAFFGVDALVVGNKGSFGIGPAFSRLASGGLEYVKLLKCSSLPKFLGRLQELGVFCLGLSEEAVADNLQELKNQAKDVGEALVLGAEDLGLSHAVSRMLPHQLALRPKGKICSLNVSVAAAVAMEKFWGAI